VCMGGRGSFNRTSPRSRNCWHEDAHRPSTLLPSDICGPHFPFFFGNFVLIFLCEGSQTI
jgi:hypothetical protein